MPDGSRSFERTSPPDLDRVAELFREHLAFVWRVLRRCGVAPSELDDAVQETFLVVHRRIGDFEGRASERTWLYAVAVRVASTLRRSSAREQSRRLRAGEQMHSSSVADPEDELARGEAARLLDTLLDELDPSKRDVFVLAELEGVAVPEIARILDVNVHTVHSRLRLARERFSSALARHRACEHGRMQRASLRHLRRATHDERPSAQRANAAWAGLALRISEGATAMPIVWKGLAGAALVKGGAFAIPFASTVAVGAVAITAAVIGAPEVSTAHATAAAQIGSTQPSTPSTPSAPSQDRPPRQSQSPALTEPATAPTIPGPNLAPTAVVPASTAQAHPRPDPAPVDTSAADATVGQDRLRAETNLLAQARAELKEGNANAALRLLDEHAKSYPNGTLAGERDSSRIKALCNADRASEASRFVEQRGENLRSVYAAHCTTAARPPAVASPSQPNPQKP